MNTKTQRKLPTKEQWETIQAVFSGLYGAIELQIDGYKVQLQRRLISVNTLATRCYVNEHYKGKWSTENQDGTWDEEARRFYQLTSKSLNSTKNKKELIKIFGIRKARKDFGLDKKFYFRPPYWNSFSSFKRHVLKENYDIELIGGVTHE